MAVYLPLVTRLKRKPARAFAASTVLSVSTLLPMIPMQLAMAAPSSNSGAKLNLKATITHSDSLPPLPPEFRVGAFYGAYGLPDPAQSGQKPGASTLKFKIPAWLAGRWQRANARETQRTELPSGKALATFGTNPAKAIDVFGTYKDKDGQIWQVFRSDRATGEVDRGQFIDRHTVAKYNIEIIGKKAVVVEVRAYHLVVSKKQMRIVEAYQDEEFNTYTQLSDGKVRTDSSVKVFDAAGAPKLLTRSVSDETRILTFEKMPGR